MAVVVVDSNTITTGGSNPYSMALDAGIVAQDRLVVFAFNGAAGSEPGTNTTIPSFGGISMIPLDGPGETQNIFGNWHRCRPFYLLESDLGLVAGPQSVDGITAGGQFNQFSVGFTLEGVSQLAPPAFVKQSQSGNPPPSPLVVGPTSFLNFPGPGAVVDLANEWNGNLLTPSPPQIGVSAGVVNSGPRFAGASTKPPTGPFPSTETMSWTVSTSMFIWIHYVLAVLESGGSPVLPEENAILLGTQG